MRVNKHILRLILLVFMAGLTMAPAMAQTSTVYAGQTTPLTVVDLPGDTYSWELYHEVTSIDFATVPGNCPASEAFFTGGINTGPSVSVTWLKPGVYIYKVTAVKAGGTNNLNVGRITVIEALPTAILAINPTEICLGDWANLSVTFTGTAPWNFKLQTRDKDSTTVKDYLNIRASNNPLMLPFSPKATSEYRVFDLTDSIGSQKDSSNSVVLTVNPLPVSSPIYLKALVPFTPIVTQSPYVIDKICAASTRSYRINGEQNSTYTWILKDSGGNVIALAKPEGTPFTDTDATGNPVYGSEIEQIWSVNPGTYSLIAEQRNASQCKAIELGSIIVVPQANVFAGNHLTICSGSLVTLGEATASGYAILDWTTSGDGVFSDKTQLNPTYIPGTADLAGGTLTLILNATGEGNAGSCTNASDTIRLTINEKITPVFSSIGPLCQNSAAPTLPTVSTNGITGTWSPDTIRPAVAGTIIYTFTPDSGLCATTTTLTVTINPDVTPTFTEIPAICSGSTAPILPTTSNEGIIGTWTPAAISTAAIGTITYTFTPDAGQCASIATLEVSVTDNIVPAITALGPYCVGATPASLPTVSTNGINGTWNPAVISTASIGTITYTFTPDAGQCSSIATLEVAVTDNIVPVITALGPYCVGATPDTLPVKSLNGITGTWSPATISTASIGTTTYTFTPNAGQCSSIATLEVAVTDNIVPVITALGPYCVGATPNTLPVKSLNGITGTWSPAIISTAAIGTTTYTFTPDSSQCASTVTTDITVLPVTVPAFDPIVALCQNSTAPILPLVSTNNINGTWSPDSVNTAIPGTFTYTFTPAAGQCATSVPIEITIKPLAAPIFTAIGPLCLNSSAPPLPLISTNNITGTWSPDSVNTAVAGTFTFTFNPAAGQCATSVPIEITIKPLATPVFTAIGPLCLNSSAPPLPAISTDSITGHWSPDSINTAVVGTTTYTFTPDSGQCASIFRMEVIVTDHIVPILAKFGPYCIGAVPDTLPLRSLNGITGTWTPAVVTTSVAGTTSYTFTPDSSQCASTVSTDITVLPVTVPTFDPIVALCQNSTAPILPLVSTNNITGTWVPDSVNTAVAGTFNFTLIPAAGQCADTARIAITVNPITTPTFDPIVALCQNSTAPILPLISTNNITGTWSPDSVNTAVAGTFNFTFIPAAGQCATSIPIEITIKPLATPVFAAISPLCLNSSAPTLPKISTDSITGRWSPDSINTAVVGTTTYTFTPDAGQCASIATLKVSVTDNIVPVITALGPYCVGATPDSLPTVSTNGITGSWSPAIVTTSVAGTTSYTFTPDSSQCASTVSADITVLPVTVPTFDPIVALCQNSTAPILPLISTNNITGTWSPDSVNTAVAGTFTFTFIPAAGQCASSVPIEITVLPVTVPAFDPIIALCQNSTAPILPLVSTNNITGTWSPDFVNTSVAGTFNFTFIPAARQCAISVPIEITIKPLATPVFTAIGPLCLNSSAPPLPMISTNSITGNWSPDSINTSIVGTATYTFTTDSSQCATIFKMDVTVTDHILPILANLGPYCIGAVPDTLPARSLNGITGTWTPAIINTTVAGITSYTFTPDAGQCAGIASMGITVNPESLPIFGIIGPFPRNSAAPALPLISLNGFSGIWNPATISTANAGTATYTFTPNAGQCATTGGIQVTVLDYITPVFTALGPYCAGSIPDVLPGTSTNGITGTWNPSAINTATAGTYRYFFTPDSNQGGLGVTMDIVISPRVIPTFGAIGPLNLDSTPPILPAASTNGITGTWNPSIISTSVSGTFTYTFNPDANQCAESTLLTITVNTLLIVSINPVPPLCFGSGVITLTGSPAGGIFSGPGVTGSSFDPASIGPGTYTITYTYSDPTHSATSATIEIVVNAAPELIITDPAEVCMPGTIDLTNPAVTAGSGSDLNLTYWLDAAATLRMNNPSSVESGTYYIKAVTSSRCSIIKPVHAVINPTPVLSITDPVPACEPNTIDITKASITAGSTSGLSYTYWTDAGATVWFATPSKAKTGIYYIKGATAAGCSVIKPVHVIITESVGTPVFFGAAPTRCRGAGTESYNATADNTTNLSYSLDAASIAGGNSINVSTGMVTYVSSWSGTSVITVSANGCNGPKTATQTVFTIPSPTATISYTGSPFCKTNMAKQPVAFTGTTGGTYTTIPAGLVIDPATGEIDPANSETGTYTVSYMVLSTGGCGAFTATTLVTVNNPPDAGITYAGSPFCTSGGQVNVTLTGSTGGIFTSVPTGLTIDAQTGTITPGTSREGSYTISYTIPATGGCRELVVTANLAITKSPAASFTYIGNPFCSNGSDPNPIFLPEGIAGTFSSVQGLVFVSTSTGQVDLSSSTPGTYTVTNTIPASGGCEEVVATSTLIITPPPVADFTYLGNPFCSSGSDPNPTFIGGGVAGIFTSQAGLVFIDIHTGQVDLSASTAGTYTVNNTIEATGGCGPVTASGTITVVKAPAAVISYPGSPFCDNNTSDQQVTFTGITGGTYSAIPAGLTINPETGAINPGTSTPGTYTVTYSISASEPCGVVTTTTSVTITALTATITYSGSEFCTSSGPLTVIFTGSPGGEFTSTPAGLSIDKTTGEITPASSQAGIYKVTYTNANGGCGVITATAIITINAAPKADIIYDGSPFCKSIATKQPVTLNGTTGGIYSATPAGLAIDPSTGELIPAISAAGLYLVTYTIARAGGCEAFTASAPVTITAIPSASIYYPGSPFCSSSLPVKVLLTGTTGGAYTALPAGLSIDGATGDITPSTSAAGTYMVTYTTLDRGCGVIQATALVTIILSPAATISYNGSPFCPTDPPASPIISGSLGGVFTASPTGLTIDGTTGKIDPGTSLSGTYLITYSFAITGGCGDVKATAEVIISSATIVTTSPKNQTVVYPANAGFGVKATGAGLSYQWQVDTGTGFVNISNTGVYSGAFTDSLRLASPPVSMSEYKYRVIVSGFCAPPAISGEAVLIVTLKEFVLTITAEGIDKMYDGNTNATVTLFDNRQPGDQLTITYTDATFDTKDVGTDKAVFVSGIMISGRDADKYGYNTTTTTTADIVPKPITLTADPGLSKVYGATDPIFTYTYSADLIKGDNFTGLLTRIPGENPGLYPILQGTLTLGNNYIIAFISNDFKITVKTVINIFVTAGQTKIYGDTDSILTYSFKPALDDGDSFTGQLSRAQGENVGDYQINLGTLTAGPKYGIFLMAPSTFTITQKPITITAVADGKVYDRTIASDEVPTIAPKLAFEDISDCIQKFDTKNVGTGKTMSPSGQIKDGNGGKNYTVTYVPADLGFITPKPITGSITANNKEYDATTFSTILDRKLAGVIGGDNVSYIGGTATFDTPTVGQGKTVTGTGFSLTGADAGNYTVNDTATTKADILVLVVGTSLTVNASTFTHYSDQVTLTATITGGAPLANGKPAAGSVTFSIEGRILSDKSNNTNIPMAISGQDLVATITVSILETTITGSMVPGTKEASATFNDESINYKLDPNPAKTSFSFIPGFSILVYPNPSPGPVNFKISVDIGTMVTLDLYASNGELVARVFEGFIPTNESKTIPFNNYLAQGIYRYRARIGDEVQTGNVIIIRVY